MTTKQMTDEYAAACSETRGRLQTKQGGSRRPYRPMVTVHCSDRRIAQALCAHFDLGNIDSFHPVSNPRMAVFVWSIKGAGCVEVLKRTAPAHARGYWGSRVPHHRASLAANYAEWEGVSLVVLRCRNCWGPSSIPSNPGVW
jgi:hypothetical protein